MDWIKEHPYLTGGLVLAIVVLFLILRGRRSSASQAVQGGPSEALQAAGLQAQVQQQGIQASADIASQQTAAALAGHLADVQVQSGAVAAARTVALQNILTSGSTAQYGAAAQLSAVQSTNLAQVDIASTQAGAAVDISGIQANRDIQIAGIQAPLTLAGIQASLAALRDTNLTSVDIAGINARTATAINAQNAGAAVNIAGINASVPLAQIRTAGDIATNQLAVYQNLTAAEMNYRQQNVQAFLPTVENIAGSQNRLSAFLALLGFPGAASTAVQAQTASSASGDSLLSGFYRGLFGTAYTAAGVVVP